MSQARELNRWEISRREALPTIPDADLATRQLKAER